MGIHAEGTKNLRVGTIHDLFPSDFTGKSIKDMGLDDRYFLLIDYMITKLDNLDVYSFGILDNVKRTERDFIVADTKNSMNSLYRLLIELKKRYYKKTAAQSLDVEIEMLRCCYRRLHTRTYITTKTFDHVMDMINELGRLYGQWKILDDSRAKARIEKAESKKAKTSASV